MVAKAEERLEQTVIRQYTVAAGNTVRRGFPVKFSGGNIVEAAAITDNAFGIALDAGNGDDTTPTTNPTTKVRVALFGNGVAKVLVGTGGATQGAPAKFVSDGTTDATVGGGTGKLRVLGQYMETGVVGDLVGINLGSAGWSVGS
jgi:hypothetical protein